MSLGKFITFEGGDGCGKTTQARLLFELLNNNNVTAIFTREPGGTEGAEEIRKLLVTGETGKWEKMSETLLYFAARHDHIEKLIKPALKREEWVVCDRFSLSTMAYQGYGHGLPLNSINGLHKFAIGEFYPEITFVYDIDVTLSDERIASRNSAIQGELEDRYERMSSTFHRNVRRGFVELAHKDRRCILINSGGSIKGIHHITVENLNARLGLKLIPFTETEITDILNKKSAL